MLLYNHCPVWPRQHQVADSTQGIVTTRTAPTLERDPAMLFRISFVVQDRNLKKLLKTIAPDLRPDLRDRIMAAANPPSCRTSIGRDWDVTRPKGDRGSEVMLTYFGSDWYALQELAYRSNIRPLRVEWSRSR